jgi:hypothetical protein
MPIGDCAVAVACGSIRAKIRSMIPGSANSPTTIAAEMSSSSSHAGLVSSAPVRRASSTVGSCTSSGARSPE